MALYLLVLDNNVRVQMVNSVTHLECKFDDFQKLEKNISISTSHFTMVLDTVNVKVSNYVLILTGVIHTV